MKNPSIPTRITTRATTNPTADSGRSAIADRTIPVTASASAGMRIPNQR